MEGGAYYTIPKGRGFMYVSRNNKQLVLASPSYRVDIPDFVPLVRRRLHKWTVALQ